MIPQIELKQTHAAANVAHALTRNHGIAFAYMDHTLNIVRTSSNFEAVVSPDGSSVLGLPLTAVLYEFTGMEETLTAVLIGEQPQFELKHINRELFNGSVAYLNFLITRVVDNSTPHLFLLIEDETELGNIHQKLIQERNQLHLVRNQLAEANQALSQTIALKELLLKMAAHDMRTPLSAIMGYASLLLSQNGVEDIETRDGMLNTIINQSERLDYLIKDVITLDKLNQNQLILDIQKTAVDPTLNEIVEALSLLTTKKNITISLNMQNTPLYAQTDQQRFWQIAYNLISNSVKYTPKNGRVEINAYQTPHHFILEVADNGPGLSQENMENLFTLYYRTESAKQSASGGFGIGLYIVKTLVEAHNGNVFVESLLGEGSTFIVKLPL